VVPKTGLGVLASDGTTGAQGVEQRLQR